MSENSNYSSGSYQNLFSRMKLNSRRQQPEIKVVTEVEAPKRPADEASFSVGVRQLNKDGYIRYNIDDEDDLFISKVPESAIFNDGEPIITKAESNVMVGYYRTTPKIEIEEPVVETRTSTEDMFANVQRGSDSIVCSGVGVYGDNALN